MRGYLASVASAAAVLALGAAARTYQFVSVGGKPQRWPDGRPTVFTDAVMAPDHAQAIRSAATTWSRVSGSSFRFFQGGNSPSADVRDHANGNSDLYFDPQLPPFGYAVTYAFETGTAIVERDVAFNGSLVWTTSGSPAGAPDVETVALHELGHVLGLLHEDAVPAVMHSGGDPSVVRRTLFPDDEDGVRFLYPAGGGSGGGKPSGPDLAAGTLAVTSGTPGAGNQVFLRAEVRNRSSLPAGPFRVIATLSPALPVTAGDEEIGTADVASLAGGASVFVALDAFVPASAAPGRYRLGAFVDPEDVLLDPERPNNGAATALFNVVRAPGAMVLGDDMDAGLGPLGRDAADLFVGGGTEVRVRARGRLGVRPVVRILGEDGAEVLAEASGGRAATLRWEAAGDGTYRVEVANAAETVGRVRLATAGSVRVRGLGASAPGEVPFAAYADGRVLLGAVYEGEAVPLACLPPGGPAITSPGSARGRRARLGPLVPDETGAHALLLGGEGPVRCSILSRTPRTGALLVR